MTQCDRGVIDCCEPVDLLEAILRLLLSLVCNWGQGFHLLGWQVHCYQALAVSGALVPNHDLNTSDGFQGLDGARVVFGRAVSLTGRCWLGSFGTWVSCGIQSRWCVNKNMV